MTPEQKVKQLLTNHHIQINKHNDCSGIGEIRPATKREIKRAYKKIGKPLPVELQPKMKILRKVSNG